MPAVTNFYMEHSEQQAGQLHRNPPTSIGMSVTHSWFDSMERGIRDSNISVASIQILIGFSMETQGDSMLPFFYILSKRNLDDSWGTQYTGNPCILTTIYTPVIITIHHKSVLFSSN
jgi:hypothetical protein